MIPIRNIYYMLSYVFQVLNEQGYKDLAAEPFHNAAELCAAILAKGVSVQLKRGLAREYREQTEPLSSPRGRIELSESMKTGSVRKKQLICSYDDFSANAYMNRILKTTMALLLRADISSERKKELRKLLLFFDDVEPLDAHTIRWQMRYNRANQIYRMLISVCYLVVMGLLQTNADGTTRLMDFFDEQRMCRLYEKFILEFYRKECPQVTAAASQIPWALNDGHGPMLPVMQSDITLTRGNKVLIIDAKYYAHATQTRYDVHTLHSGNLYQIFTYVKNTDAQFGNRPHEVSGLLLYAATDEVIQPQQRYRMSGNRIGVKTLDLNRDFWGIEEQLKGIVEEYFPE